SPGFSLGGNCRATWRTRPPRSLLPERSIGRRRIRIALGPEPAQEPRVALGLAPERALPRKVVAQQLAAAVVADRREPHLFRARCAGSGCEQLRQQVGAEVEVEGR